ncbi:hypothetical protein BGW38_009960, partial [Lunasporangiospora selenospora]
LEAVVFIGGVTFQEKVEAIPAAVLVGVAAGLSIGYLLYRGGNSMKLHPFFVGSTCLLLLVAAGLVSKGIQAFEDYHWGQVTGAQSDDEGSFDPRINVWALKCCDPKQPDAGGWQLFNAILGWSNIASYFTIGGYILYWVTVISSLVYLKWNRQAKAFALLSKGSDDSADARPLLRRSGSSDNYADGTGANRSYQPAERVTRNSQGEEIHAGSEDTRG